MQFFDSALQRAIQRVVSLVIPSEHYTIHLSGPHISGQNVGQGHRTVVYGCQRSIEAEQNPLADEPLQYGGTQPLTVT